MIIFLEILLITSVLPFGNLIKDRSLTCLSENLSNPIEEIANTRLVILNSGKRVHLNLYFLFLCISCPLGGLLRNILNSQFLKLAFVIL